MSYMRAWIRAGLHGTMSYLGRDDAIRRRSNVSHSMPDFKSAIIVAHSYADTQPGTPDDDPSRAIVARYARGKDYHHVLARGLSRLADRMTAKARRTVRHRLYVDTGPIGERELAHRAGLGWFGKNTLLIHPRRGSYFFLGVLLTDVGLTPTGPVQEDRCGTCRRCLDSCPTNALLGRDEDGAPIMDASRCISYLTIELKGPIPLELRPKIGNRVFGCDICQEVCPWNLRFSRLAEEPAYTTRRDLDNRDLIALAQDILAMSGKEFGRQYANSPIARARRGGMLRNICVALGNGGSPEALPVLQRAARDPSALVREHAMWALARIGGDQERQQDPIGGAAPVQARRTTPDDQDEAQAVGVETIMCELKTRSS